jgi:SPP1 family predicted phage head-tail adaptor
MARSYKAGDLRHKVTLQEPVVTMEGNRRKVTWAPHEMMAGKRGLNSREFFAAHGEHVEDIVIFTIRYRGSVTCSWRVKHGSATYDVIGIGYLGFMRDFMQLRCREVKGGGA